MEFDICTVSMPQIWLVMPCTAPAPPLRVLPKVLRLAAKPGFWQISATNLRTPPRCLLKKSGRPQQPRHSVRWVLADEAKGCEAH